MAGSGPSPKYSYSSLGQYVGHTLNITNYHGVGNAPQKQSFRYGWPLTKSDRQ
jgi:hypothetical protein